MKCNTQSSTHIDRGTLTHISNNHKHQAKITEFDSQFNKLIQDRKKTIKTKKIRKLKKLKK